MAFYLLLFCACSNLSEPIKYYPLYPFKYGKFNGGDTRADYYVVKNLNINDSVSINQLDSIVRRIIPKDIDKYVSYQIIFYKYGGDLNENYKYDDEELIEWKGDEALLEYNWRQGNFSYLVFNPYIDKRKTSFYKRF